MNSSGVEILNELYGKLDESIFGPEYFMSYYIEGMYHRFSSLCEKFLKTVDDALLKANEKGLAPIVYFLSERNKKTLTVPQGVQLKEGQLLSFYNGRTYNGIVVNGYATLRSRGIPAIKEVDKASGRVFWKIYAPENNDVKKLVSSLYAACPMPEREEVEIVMEEVAAA